MSLMTVQRVKAELRITDDADDARLEGLIDEAVSYLQRFKSKTLVATVSDEGTEVSLTLLDERFVYVYCEYWYDKRPDLKPVLDMLTLLVREGQ